MGRVRNWIKQACRRFSITAFQTESWRKRLKELTVDVKTVQLTKKPDMNAAAKVDVTGKWDVLANAGGQAIDLALNLKQAGSEFNGTMSSLVGDGTIENGKVSGNNFTAVMQASIQGQAMSLNIEGKIDGDKMTGTISGPGIPLVPFTATRAK